MVIIKVAALSAALMLGGGAAADTCNCPPPPIETVSCLAGVPSFARATCTTGKTFFHGFPFEILSCRPGEFAISAGYRTLLDTFSGGVPIMVQMAPIVGPTGDHAHGYRFVWQPGGDPNQGVTLQQALAQVKVYITCEAEAAGSPAPTSPTTAGPTGLDVTTVFNNANSNNSASVFCPPDHPFALGGGGVATTFTSPTAARLSQSRPMGVSGPTGPNSPARGWYVEGDYPGEYTAAYAICAK